MKGKKIPIRKTAAKGPIEADDRLMANWSTDPNFSTTNTKPGKNQTIIGWNYDLR